MAQILVVDGSRFIRAMIRRALEESGHTVTEASSGQEALEIIRSKSFDVITIDLLMPQMRGQELIAHLRRQAPASRVIMITALLVLHSSTMQTFVNRSVAEEGELVKRRFRGEISSSVALMIPNHESKTLLDMLQQYPHAPPSLTSSPSELLSEVGNIILNATVGTLSNTPGTSLQFNASQVFQHLNRSTLVEHLLPTMPRPNGLGGTADQPFASVTNGNQPVGVHDTGYARSRRAAGDRTTDP